MLVVSNAKHNILYYVMKLVSDVVSEGSTCSMPNRLSVRSAFSKNGFLPGEIPEGVLK